MVLATLLGSSKRDNPVGSTSSDSYNPVDSTSSAFYNPVGSTSSAFYNPVGSTSSDFYLSVWAVMGEDQHFLPAHIFIHHTLSCKNTAPGALTAGRIYS